MYATSNLVPTLNQPSVLGEWYHFILFRSSMKLSLILKSSFSGPSNFGCSNFSGSNISLRASAVFGGSSAMRF